MRRTPKTVAERVCKRGVLFCKLATCKLEGGRSHGAVRVNNLSMWIMVGKAAPFMGLLPKQSGKHHRRPCASPRSYGPPFSRRAAAHTHGCTARRPRLDA